MHKENLSKLVSETGGWIYCDGVVIDNVFIICIDFADEEIILYDKKENEVGIIAAIHKRNSCIFAEDIENNLDFFEHTIIKNGEVVI